MLLCRALVVILITGVHSEDVFVSRSDGIYHVEFQNNGIAKSSRVLQSSNGEMIALAIDTHDSLLFWYDSSEGREGIYRGNVVGRDVTTTTSIVQYPEMHVTGLAVDWVIKHLYWSDSVHSSVIISDYNGDNRVVAVTSKLMLPRGISVDPINRSLYIGDQGSHIVLRCAMDGLFSCTHTTEAVWPNQLSASSRNVSWTDGWSNKFVRCSSELSDCQNTVVNTQNLGTENVTSLFGMVETNSGIIVSILNDFITISIGDNRTRTQPKIVGGNTYYMISTSTATQPTVRNNPCSINNQGCSQLCFSDSRKRYRCSCSSLSSNVIATNGKTCVPSTKFLVYAEEDRGQIGLVSPTLKGHTVIAWSPQPRALAYDPLTKMLYFSDTKYHTISKVGLDGSSLAVFLSKENNIGNVEAMTLDQQQRRLYFINRFKWEVNNMTRSMTRIEMAGLTTDERVLIRETEDSITDIEIIHHQTASYLYYAVGDPSPAVYKMSLDGRKRVSLMLTSVTNPTRLSSSGGTLFVLNNQELIVWSGGVTENHDLTSQAVSMTSDSGYVYLSSGGFSMFKLNRQSGNAGSTVSSDVDPIDLLYVDTRSSGSTADSGLCNDDNLCKRSSVCIKTDNPDIVRCKCPANKFNTPTDGSRTCTEPTKYLLVSDVDGIKMTSFDDVLRNVYTIVPNEDTCSHYHGLTTDGERIFFAGYDGKILYTASIKGEDATVLKVLRNMTVLNLAYHDNTLYWTGHYDCYMYNGSADGTLQCEDFDGRLGGVFSLDVSPGSTNERQVTTLVTDIDDPQGVHAESSFLYWSDPSVVKHLSLRDSSPVPVIVSRTPNVVALQQNKQQTHLFLGGADITMKRFASRRNFNSEVVYSGLSDVRGMSVQGSLVFASDWTNRSVIQYDLRTHQTRVIANNLGRPGQIVAFGLDTSIADKPGNCPKESSCSSVTSISCQNDVDCVDGFRSKCCLTVVNNQCRRECVPPVAEATCNITFSGQPSFTWGYETVTNDKCTTCKCTMDGRSMCSPVQCPSLGGCGFIIREQGTCCSVCRDITTCQQKPNIVGCPNNTIAVPLPTTLPEDPGVPVELSLEDLPAVKSITAFSCNLQEIPDNKITLMPSFVTWQRNDQKVSLIANDDNGIARCDMKVRVVDTTKPVFVDSPNDTISVIIAQDKKGAPALWTPPVVYDNSGFRPIITTNNRTNGALLPPAIHEIVYIATDRAANRELIKFYVNITLIPDLKCPPPPFFHHGSMTCKKGADDVISCTAKCQRNFLFKTEFNTEYSCMNGKWNPAFKPRFEAACFAPQPTIMKLSTSTMIDCKRKEIKAADIVECLRSRLPCNSDNIILCDQDAISIEQTDSYTTVTVQISASVPYTQDNFNDALITVNRTLATKALTVERLFSTEELVESCPSLGCSFVKTNKRTFLKTCEKGSLTYNVAGRSICGKCPPGTRFLETNGRPKCEFCGAGTYQDEQGQTDCKSCPAGRPYSKAGIWLIEHCTRSLNPTDDSEFQLVPIVVGVLVGFVALIVVLVIILVVVKKRQARGKLVPNSHTNPAFNIPSDDYDSIPADQNDPNYTSLAATGKSDKAQYASLGQATTVTFKNSSGANAKGNSDNPYDLVGETNPYDALRLNSAPENPYESAIAK